jgi:hypothetical protein
MNNPFPSKEKLAAQRIEREADYKRFADLLSNARTAGELAGAAVMPVAMTVNTANILTGQPDGRQSWHVPEGVCGFAWIAVRPATSRFALWLIRNGFGRRDSYAGGLRINVSQFGQSLQRKEAYAEAFAEVLRAAGFNAYAQSRMD